MEHTMSTRAERTDEDLGKTLKEAVNTLGADIAKTTYDADAAFRKTQRALNASVAHAFEDMGSQSAQAVEGLKEQVRQHPMTYVAAAAGIGLLVGFLLHRR
jgi:ElaB/YqjD/DUF883 family membrane-anchored ribosome-binding protein